MGYRLTSIPCLCIVLWPGFALAQNAIPDFTGTWTRKWVTAGTYDAPPSGPGPVMVAQEHHGHLDKDGPNAWVADYNNPILKPEARERVKRVTEEEIAHHPHRENQSLCLPMGVPDILNLRDNMWMLPAPTGNEISFFYSRDNQIRHVYLNVEHSKDPPKTWYGESVGRYEGDTLVVDTIGLSDKAETDRFGTPHSDQIHVVERYRLSDDRQILEVLFTVDDPKFFTTVWSGRADYRRNARIYGETVCAEGNQSTGVSEALPIPTATKPDF